MNSDPYNLYRSQVLNEHQYQGAQLRYDLFHDKWILVSRQNGAQPVAYHREERSELLRDKDQAEYTRDRDDDITDMADTLIYRDPEGAWTTRVFPHKYSVVQPIGREADISEGPYPRLEAVGMHEVVLTRSDKRTFALLDTMELAEVLDAYQERYLTMMRERHVRSITIFHNYGIGAGGPGGGSVVPSHSQILALPIVSRKVTRELQAATRYRRQTQVHLFGLINEYEREEGTRMVYENDLFIVYCPFASVHAYEMRVLPKKPQPYFERITPREKVALADALRCALKALYDGLDDPDFNYYVRTAPCNGQDYPDFSYYIEIFPRTHIKAGFEAATDIDILPVAPEDAAAYLRTVVEKF